MIEKDNIDDLFESLKGQLDLEEPQSGHEARFLSKLKAEGKIIEKKSNLKFWKPLLAIAASIVICLSVFTVSEPEETGLASVSPEMSQAQDIFTATIKEELVKLEAERSPLTENIIYEAERQLTALDEDYKKLTKDLKQSGNDKRVIYAMITNFQARIDILNNILEQIEDLKNKTNDLQNTL